MKLTCLFTNGVEFSSLNFTLKSSLWTITVFWLSIFILVCDASMISCESSSDKSHTTSVSFTALTEVTVRKIRAISKTNVLFLIVIFSPLILFFAILSYIQKHI